MISLKGIPNLANSSLVWCSCIISLSPCVVTVSWMGKPSHMCETISMLGMVFLVLMLWCLLAPELVACLPTSFLFRLVLWLSVVVSFLGLLCGFGGGVVSARLMASNRDNNMVAWFGAAVYSSCDVESWRELPSCSVETSSSYMSMSKSWNGAVCPFKVVGWLADGAVPSSSSSL